MFDGLTRYLTIGRPYHLSDFVLFGVFAAAAAIVRVVVAKINFRHKAAVISFPLKQNRNCRVMYQQSNRKDQMLKLECQRLLWLSMRLKIDLLSVVWRTCLEESFFFFIIQSWWPNFTDRKRVNRLLSLTEIHCWWINMSACAMAIRWNNELLQFISCNGYPLPFP